MDDRRGIKRGEQNQAIGHLILSLSKDAGRTHDQDARAHRPRLPPAHLLSTDGQVADSTAGALSLERLPACRIVLADTGYASDAIRRQIEAARAAPNIPPKVN